MVFGMDIMISELENEFTEFTLYIYIFFGFVSCIDEGYLCIQDKKKEYLYEGKKR